jgi:EAL domain-containing protein (putative c-di-GMP-specific phosphodiesterase class I)
MTQTTNSDSGRSAETPVKALFTNALVIDDDPLAQIVVSEALLQGGLEKAETADDGVEGLEKLVNSPDEIDLIAIDLQMPKMTGVDVVRELGRTGFKGGIIIISSEDSGLLRAVHNLAKLLKINILGTLQKPLNVGDLNRLIQKKASKNGHERKRVLSRAEVVSAFREQKIVPFYQPKIDLETGLVSGFEVLARHVDHGETAPAPWQYLEAIEKFGLSIEFLSAMITKAAEDCKTWLEQLGPVKLSFNLTPLAVQDSGLPDRLLSLVQNVGLDPNSIAFEITENHLLECTAASLEVLSLMRLYGFALSIDDFGTGATSIEQLRTFPFTELKIDGRFMMASEDDAFSRLTVEASAKLARIMGMNVVAEGVETPEAIEFARDVGANEVQGFHFARAMSAKAVPEWFADHGHGNPDGLRANG